MIYTTPPIPAVFECKSAAPSTNNLGLIFYEFKDFKKSLICYQKVIEINPNNSHTHHNLGLLFYAQKEFEKAIIHYKKSVQINPNQQYAWIELLLLYLHKVFFLLQEYFLD